MSEFDVGGFVGPHEIHITVSPDTTDADLFRRVCGDLEVKAHVICNEIPGGGTVIDYLTGSEINGRSGQAFTEMGRIAAGLRAEGFDVVREKIETTPWHPMSPKTALDQMEPGTYFECHFTLPDEPTMHSLRPLEFGGIPFLLSSTESKRQKNLLFATMRHYIATAGSFVEGVNNIHASLAAQLGDIKHPTVEFALYDSNPAHDKKWVDAYRSAQAK